MIGGPLAYPGWIPDNDPSILDLLSRHGPTDGGSLGALPWIGVKTCPQNMPRKAR